MDDVGTSKTKQNSKKMALKELREKLKEQLSNTDDNESPGLYSLKTQRTAEKLLDITVAMTSRPVVSAAIKTFQAKESDPSKFDHLKKLETEELKKKKRNAKTPTKKSPLKFVVPDLNEILHSNDLPKNVQQSNKMVQQWLSSSFSCDDNDIDDDGDDELVDDNIGPDVEFVEAHENSNIRTLMETCSPPKQICMDPPVVADEFLTVRVKYENKVFRYPFKKDQLFTAVVEKLAKERNIPAKCIIVLRNSEHVPEKVTLESLQLKVAEILECFVKPIELGDLGSTNEEVEDDVNKISLKFQSEDRRSTVTMKVSPNDLFREIKNKYAEIKEVDVSKIVFIFDGEKIADQTTPEELDMENDDCIDVTVK